MNYLRAQSSVHILALLPSGGLNENSPCEIHLFQCLVPSLERIRKCVLVSRYVSGQCLSVSACYLWVRMQALSY